MSELFTNNTPPHVNPHETPKNLIAELLNIQQQVNQIAYVPKTPIQPKVYKIDSLSASNVMQPSEKTESIFISSNDIPNNHHNNTTEYVSASDANENLSSPNITSNQTYPLTYTTPNLRTEDLHKQ